MTTSTRDRIADLLAEGKKPREIALELGCTTQNVYKHIARLEKKEPAARTAGSGAGSSPHSQSTGA